METTGMDTSRMSTVRKNSKCEAVWKIDSEDKAVYVDFDDGDSDTDDADHVYSFWSDLPDLLLEKIFSYLSISQKYYASMVCVNWNRAFYLPYVWSTFVLDDATLTRRKYNYYMGWQKVLDHYRTQVCLNRIGKHMRDLIFAPMWNLFSLYEFMNILSYYAENYSTITKISWLKFTFSCNMANNEEQMIYGTGGKILEALMRLMGNLPNLKHLELNDLLLDCTEASHLLDEVCCVCCETLETLTIINTTRLQFPLLHAGVFVNLQVLTISPQNLGNDVVRLISGTSLANLHIVQNSYTEEACSVSRFAWAECRRNNPRLRVHLISKGKTRRDMIWQELAPVRSVVYDSPYAQITTMSVITVLDLYCGDLEVYAHKSLPRFYMPKSFHERVDSTLLLICRQCPNLHTLMIRERISTATVLLICHTAKNLHYFYVRKNAIILRADWPRSPEWSEEFYIWLRTSSRSYEAMEREVSQMLDHPWAALTDKQFKLVQLNLNSSPYL